MKRLIALFMIVAVIFVPGCKTAPVDDSDVQMEHEVNEPSAEIAPEGDEPSGTEDTGEAAGSVAEPSGEANNEPTEDLTEAVTEQTTEASTTPATEPTEPPHSHSYSSSTVAATCAAQGYTLHSCSCGDSYTDNYAAALGHAYADTVIAPTTSAGGYTQHTCSRCGDSYTDTYTEQLWWDDEATVARICAEANAYIESIGCIVDPTAASWVAPQYTHWEGSSEAWLRRQIWDAISINISDGAVTQYVSYEPDPDGGWWVYIKYSLYYFE